MFNESLADPALNDRFTVPGATAAGGTPQQFARLPKDDLTRRTDDAARGRISME